MPGKPCSCCISLNRAEIDRAVVNRHPTRETARLYGVSASAVARHRAHVDLEPSPPASSSHRAEAEGVIAAVKVLRAGDYSQQDEAEAGQLRSLAAAVDSDPGNVAGLRELRVTLASFRRGAFQPSQGEQTELAQLIASIQSTHFTRPTLYDEVYVACREAGGSEEAALAAAEAATTRPPATWTK